MQSRAETASQLPEKVLDQVAVAEPRLGTEGRKAIMNAIRKPVSQYAGEAVQFNGKIRASGPWARFVGSVAAADGSPPQSEGIAAALERDFAALLSKDENGEWQTLHWGFAGDPSVLSEALEKHPQAPWPLFEWIE